MKKVFVLLLSLLFAACEKPRIQTYSVPHEIEKSPLMANDPAEVPASTHIQVEWLAPKSWTEQATTAFRKGSYLIEGKNGSKAEVSVISFPGDAGGLAANVNRWRNQIGLPPIEGEALEKSLSKIKAGDQEIIFLEISNSTPNGKNRVLGGILLLGNEESWFFKMSGEDTLVASQKKAFLNLLSSVKVHHSH